MRCTFSKLAGTVTWVGLLAATAWPGAVFADGPTLTRSCQDMRDPDCVVQVVPVPASSVVASGPSTGFGPAVEISLATMQLADAGGIDVHHGGAVPAGGAQPGQPGGSATNTFNAAVGQTGTATATSGNATADQQSSQAGGSSATQNQQTGSTDQSGGGSPPSGSTSGVNMITNIASVVQIVQVVARDNSNTTIAPTQVAQQCQQAAASCTGVSSSGH
jgi:hypothetical protein